MLLKTCGFVPLKNQIFKNRAPSLFCRKKGKRSTCYKYCHRYCCRPNRKAEAKMKTLGKKEPFKDTMKPTPTGKADISDEFENSNEKKDNTGKRGDKNNNGNIANKRNCCCSEQNEEKIREDPRVIEERFKFRNMMSKAVCCCSGQAEETRQEEGEPEITEERFKFRNMRDKDNKANKRKCCCSEQNEEARQEDPRIIKERFNFRNMINKADCCCSEQREEATRQEEEPEIIEERFKFWNARRRGKSGSKTNRKMSGQTRKQRRPVQVVL